MKPLRILPLAALLFAAACGSSSGGSSGPTAGTLFITYATPNSDDGALLLKVTGAAVSSVTADTTLKAYSRISADGDTLMLVVAGAVHNGVVARISVPDTRAVANYVGTVLQVAQSGTFAQRNLTGYSVAVSQ